MDPRPSLLSAASWPVLPIVLGLLLGACEPDAPGSPSSLVDDPELGMVNFPTSCSDEVQPRLERGVLMLHHMMYVEAESAFQAAAEAEPDCAMAHWGLAMAHFQPFWGSAEVEEGRVHAQRAVELGAPTEREGGYLRAAMAFYEDPDANYAQRIRNWEAASETLHQTFPDDPEAAAFFALAHLSVASDDPAHQERTAGIVHELRQEMPRHPGAIHYGIHVHDVDARAHDGVEFAQAYGDIAPSIPHALHMPSHIYVRTGDWDAVIEWNRASADAALEHPAGEYISHHHPHALDYLMYGHLQRGDDVAAEEVLQELRAREDYQPTFVSAYALGAIPARWYVERNDWEGALELVPREPATFPWDQFPEAEAMVYFAHGLAAARLHDVEGAREASTRLQELETSAVQVRDEYWAQKIQVQRRSIDAWQALAEGRIDEAISEMRAAAELDGEMEKHPVTPGDLQPAYELLGDLLMEAEQPAEALTAYETSLETWPNRYHTLLGAARAARELDEHELSRAYYDDLLALATDAHPDRTGVEEARSWIQAN